MGRRRFAFNRQLMQRYMSVMGTIATDVQASSTFDVFAFECPESVKCVFDRGVYAEGIAEDEKLSTKYITSFGLVGAMFLCRAYFAAFWHPHVTARELAHPDPFQILERVSAVQAVVENPLDDAFALPVYVGEGTDDENALELERVFTELRGLTAKLLERAEETCVVEKMSLIDVSWSEEVFKKPGVSFEAMVLPVVERGRFYGEFLAAFNRFRHDAMRDLWAMSDTDSEAGLLKMLQHHEFFMGKMELLDLCCWELRHNGRLTTILEGVPGAEQELDETLSSALRAEIRARRDREAETRLFGEMHRPVDLNHKLITKAFVRPDMRQRTDEIRVLRQRMAEETEFLRVHREARDKQVLREIAAVRNKSLFAEVALRAAAVRERIDAAAAAAVAETEPDTEEKSRKRKM